MDSRNTNFRVILALTTLPQDVNLTDTSLKVTLANSTKTITLQNKEATPLDFTGVQVGSKIEFGLEDSNGLMFGYSEFKVPNTAFEKNETEINEQLRFYLINREKDFFTANVYIIFLNKGLFKERALEKGSATKAKEVQRRKDVSPGSRSPLRSPEKSSPTKNKAAETKNSDKNFQAYMSRLVDSHSAQLRSLVDEHNSVNEYIHLNKMQNNLPQNFATESTYTSKHSTVSPTKFKADGRAFTEPAESSSPLQSNGSNPENRVIHISSTSVEREKKASLPSMEEAQESPLKSGGRKSKSPSPLKMLERKLSEGSNTFSSPMKKKNFGDIAMSTSRRDAPDVTFYNAQITTLNYTITNQNTRIADLEVHRRENDELKSLHQKSEASRKVLQDSILETTAELKLENSQLERQIAQVLREKDDLIKKVSEMQNSIQDLNNVLSSTQAALHEKEDLNTQNQLKLSGYNSLKVQFKQLQDSSVASEGQRIADQETYKQSLTRFETSLQDTKRTIDSLNQEKRKLIQELSQTQQELSAERTEHQITQNELQLTKKKLENAENYKDVVNGLEKQRDQLTIQLADSRNSHSQTQALLGESIEKLAARQREFETTEKEFQRETNTLKEKLFASDNKGDRLTKDLNEQRVKVSQLNSTISGLEQLICVKEDVNKQLDSTSQQLHAAQEDRKVLRSQLEALAVTQDQAARRCIEVETTANQLRQAIEEREEYIEELVATVVALREAMEVYVPTKGDVIDNVLADYINTRNDTNKVKMLFVRENEGVYQFGSKRIYVKVEGEKILIRVGGGFLTIDEFMDKYGALEIEKLCRTDPLKKLTKNIAVNKTLIGKCVNQLEKSKTQSYEYRSDVGNNFRILNSSPSLPRTNSKGDN